MKAKELIKYIEQKIKEHGDVEVVVSVYDDCSQDYIEINVYRITTEDNSYDKRLKQETKIVIN